MILILYARPATKPYQVTPNNFHNKSIIVQLYRQGSTMLLAVVVKYDKYTITCE
jgi:hypothetical protein